MGHSTRGKNEVDMNSLLETIHNTYGYDFRHYAKASLKRRLSGFLEKYELQSYAELEQEFQHNKALFNELLLDLSITVTEMFRDPIFYRAFRSQVVPVLKTYPFIKIWHAGCATGEEVYSMAILLYEEGFLKKSTIYATDFNNKALETARQGIYAAQHVKQYISNYNQAGGKAVFSDYYHASYGAVKMHDFLKDRVTFSHHNLVSDKVFGEMNVILCRNVLIYFDRELQDRVLMLFNDSLCHRGYLCLGTKESLNYTALEDSFEILCAKEKIYRKRGKNVL